MAEKFKAEKKQIAIASLRDCPTSPRKMRIVADTVRGVEVNRALAILRYSKKEASIKLEKLLRSAIANWEAKNPDLRLEGAGHHYLQRRHLPLHEGVHPPPDGAELPESYHRLDGKRLLGAHCRQDHGQDAGRQQGPDLHQYYREDHVRSQRRQP